ncbi:hypothetical protein [Elizabethkingia anophelis]|uniref:hypothetical protein n=1 Tax=Elizabethkingia anophelis TaxID=1117645 RepID=UPI0016269FEE|nr:hypothetical protein [Elizabethkingia anophelis]
MENDIINVLRHIWESVVFVILLFTVIMLQSKIIKLELLNKYASGIAYEDDVKVIKVPNTANIIEIKALTRMGFKVITEKKVWNAK